MDTQVADSLLGSLIDGRYRVRGRVARGGMATVYTAIDERLERTVALKIIHPAQARDTHFIERFTDEAKTIALLTHPNVVAVYDQGSHAGMPYLVMEYVRGRTLRDILAERRRLAPGEALAIMEQMLAAIAIAHRAGLVHRDVKPENVLVAEAPSGGSTNLVDAVVKVADFGLAQAVEASADEATGGHLMATVAYVAPELVTDGHADPRTDVYSAGIVLFEMVTGRVPYDGDRPVEVAWQHVDRDVPAPSKYVAGLPPALDDLVARATRRDPGARPTDAGAMLAEVQVARDDLGASLATTAVLRPVAAPTVAVPPVQPTHRPPWARLPGPPAAPRPRPAGGTRRPATTAPSWRDRLRHLHRRIVAHPQGRIGLVAAFLAVALLVGFGAWWFSVGRYTTAPALTTVSKVEAEQKASLSGFHLAYDGGRYDEKIPKDTVVGQRPTPGGRIVKGGTITLTLSLGPERYKIPDIVGKAYELAVADLERLHLVPIRKEAYDDNMPAGSVLSVDPPVDKEVKRDTKVTVTVSRGRAPLTVPNVVGQNVNDAQQTLRGMGLVVQVEEQNSDKPQGQVIGQTPPDGSGVEPGATVKLTVSKGPQQIPMPGVKGRACAEAKTILEGAHLRVNIMGINPNGAVAEQTPAEGTP
ncbi:MAG TPA: Stk1 family PASTA domain-containing Ser/Thr kinase, partial [Micromonosporaceae bacterium]|nr:Stk1 family PASTA domain-containing Ser/Thr kinase [Micromonosporaceae bacterium]